MYAKHIKRLLDFILSALALLALSPLLFAIALLVRIKLGSPVIFRQQRPGKDEKIFTMYKFRSMTDEHNENGELLPDAQRLNRFGVTLRAASLDELPELFNIIKGDMSIVGPRPQLVRDMMFMTDEQRRRHQIRPGLTGLAQVNGRNNISWAEKINYDLQYIGQISFREDFKIICGTVIKVIRKEDIGFEDLATSEDLGDFLLHSGEVSQKEYENKKMASEELLSNWELGR